MNIKTFWQLVTVKRYVLLSVLALVSASVTAQGLLGNDASGLGTGIANALSGFFGESGSTTVSQAQVAELDRQVLQYRYEPSVTPLSKQMVLEVMEVDPSMQAEVSLMLDSYTLAQQQEFFAYIFSDHPANTWQANNMGDVFAFATLIFFVLADDLEGTTPQQDNGVRDFISVALSQHPEVISASNRDKQIVTEGMMMMTMLLLQMLEQAAVMDMTEVLTFMQESSVDILIGFGLHPDIFYLGETGIEPSPAFARARPQIAAGTLSFETAFPQVAADYRRLGIDQPVVTPLQPNQDRQAGRTSLPVANPLLPSSTNPLNPLSPSSSPPLFAGSFSDGKLTLSLQSDDGYSYSGHLLFNGQRFAVEADSSADGQKLLGQFYAEGSGYFSFEAVWQGSSLIFESDGNRFILTAQ